MLCEKCGTQNKEGAGFCEICGAALNAGKGTGKKKGGWLGKVILLLIAAAALYVAVVGSGVLGGGASTPEAAAEKTVTAVFNGDMKAVVNQYPSKVIKAALKDGGYKNKDELAEELAKEFNSRLEDIIALLESGVRFTVKAVGKTANDPTSYALKNAQSFYGELGLKVTSYVYVDVEVTASLDGMEETRSLYVPVAKIDGAWYVTDYSDVLFLY